MLHQKKSLCRGTLILSCLLLLTFTTLTSAQVIDRRKLASMGVPRHLLPSLKQRLAQFIEYQRTEQWDKLPQYLVDFYFYSLDKEQPSYTPDQIRHSIERLKETHIISFTPLETAASTANQYLPLNKRMWQIWGCAEFKETAKTLKTEALIIARYLNQSWVFSTIGLMKSSGDGSTVPCLKKASKDWR
jgi:hypothetical protein